MLTAFPDNTQTLIAQVVTDLLSKIKRGELNEGDRLPSRRHLAREYRVSETTIRSALGSLALDGYVTRSQRSRPYVSRRMHVKELTEPTSLSQNTVAILASRIDVEECGNRESGWSASVSDGAVAAIVGHGFNVLTVHAKQISAATAREMSVSRVRGAILPDVEGHPAMAAFAGYLHAAGVPFVVHDDSPDMQQYDRVISNHEYGAYVLTRRLIAKGCRRIIPVWSDVQESYWRNARLRGYRKAILAAGLVPFPGVNIPTDIRHQSSVPELELWPRIAAGFLVDRLIGADSCDALLVPSDGLVPGIALACRLCGREPGRDITLVGYDNYWRDLPTSDNKELTPAATIEKHNRGIGAAMVALLEDRVSGRLESGPVLRFGPEPELVETNHI